MSGVQALGAFVAHPWHCDVLGHVNVRHYAAAADDAIFTFWRRMGLDPSASTAPAAQPVTAELRLHFEAEMCAGTVARLEACVLRVGGKSVSLGIGLTEDGSQRPLARCEVVEVFIDTGTRQSCAIPPELRARLEALAEQHARASAPGAH